MAGSASWRQFSFRELVRPERHGKTLNKADDLASDRARNLRHRIDNRYTFLGGGIARERGALDGSLLPTADYIGYAALQGISDLYQTPRANAVRASLILL